MGSFDDEEIIEERSGDESQFYTQYDLNPKEKEEDEPYFLSTAVNVRCGKWKKDEESLKPTNSQRGPPSKYTRIRRVLTKSFQVTSVLICLVCMYTLVDNVVSLMSTKKNSTADIRELIINNWMVGKGMEKEASAFSPSLLNLPDFYFILNNVSICGDEKEKGKDIYFLVLVHSAPDHFEERQAIRSTWGSVKSIMKSAIRLVFLIGKDSDGKHFHMEENAVERSVARESHIFGDIVSGNFLDTYRNLTYKHMMGYKWVINFCPHATFVLKTDDDAFIDIFQLFDLTSRSYGFSPENTLLCNVFPEGLAPIRGNSQAVIKDGSVKWAVTRKEYEFDVYPKYCGGLAYLITPDLIKSFFALSESVRFFWIDDVFVTGILRELAQKEPFYLNLRYSYDPIEYRKWLEERKKINKIPTMILHVERGDNFSEEMNRLWRKTMRVWS